MKKQWGKFLYYSPKICLASNGAESDVNKLAQRNWLATKLYTSHELGRGKMFLSRDRMVNCVNIITLQKSLTAAVIEQTVRCLEHGIKYKAILTIFVSKNNFEKFIHVVNNQYYRYVICFMTFSDAFSSKVARLDDLTLSPCGCSSQNLSIWAEMWRENGKVRGNSKNWKFNWQSSSYLLN